MYFEYYNVHISIVFQWICFGLRYFVKLHLWWYATEYLSSMGWVGNIKLSVGWVGLKKWCVGLVWVTKTGPTAMSGLPAVATDVAVACTVLVCHTCALWLALDGIRCHLAATFVWFPRGTGAWFHHGKVRAWHHHSQSTFATTQLNNWYSFYHLEDGGRLNLPGWLLQTEKVYLSAVTCPRIKSATSAYSSCGLTHVGATVMLHNVIVPNHLGPIYCVSLFHYWISVGCVFCWVGVWLSW